MKKYIFYYSYNYKMQKQKRRKEEIKQTVKKALRALLLICAGFAFWVVAWVFIVLFWFAFAPVEML